MSHPLKRLFEASWQEVAVRPDKLGGRSIKADWPLPQVSENVAKGESSGYAVLGHLEAAKQEARQSGFWGLIDVFEEAEPYLTWTQNQNYLESTPDHPFLSGYAFAMVAGPGGAIELTRPLCGYILFGPNVHYPPHHHAPREIYLPMAPGVTWQLDQGSWFDVDPGDLIFHDHWQVHAAKSGDTPALAFAAWLDEGDRSGVQWVEDSDE